MKKILLYPLLPDFQKNISFLEVSKLHPFILPVREQHVHEDEYGA